MRIGLVNRIWAPEELLEGALGAARQAAAKGPLAVSLAKRVLDEGQDADTRTAHALEQNGFGLIFGTEDHAEGMDAFLEKRDPVFRRR